MATVGITQFAQNLGDLAFSGETATETCRSRSGDRTLGRAGSVVTWRPKMTASAGGFDRPVASADEDHLGRWAFAREVAAVAMTAPSDWSVRIGVYGRWGYGKTSVLNFVRKIAEADGHLVAGFNPWGCTSEDAMWEAFADSVLGRVRELGITLPQAEASRRRAQRAKALRKAEALAKALPDAAQGLAAALAPSLRDFLAVKGPELAAIPQALSEGKRVIVLIDDLDRTDPRLLPQMLFALREVLDTPGYSYVLALDPTVVGAALATYHPGFGNGREFLEKIVEFPRWLSEPTDEDLWRLVLVDSRRHCDFVDLEALKQEFDLFPRVPRQLKTFVRSFWLLRAELQRHDSDEIRWPLLVLTQLLKNASQGYTNALLADGTLLKRVLKQNFALKSSPVEELRDELVQLATVHFEGAGGPEAIRAVRMALRLGERSFWLPEQVAYHAFLTERPHPVTWKEFRALRASVSVPATPEAVRRWIVEHARERAVPHSAVLRDLFSAAVRLHNTEMERAISAKAEATMQAHAIEVDAALQMIEVLAFDLGGFTTSDSPLQIADFIELKRSCFTWAHFRNTKEYEALRRREAEILARIIREANMGALSLLADLAPWNSEERRGGQPLDAYELKVRLARLACTRVGTDVLHVFEIDSGIASVASDAKRAAEQYLLFRAQSPAWSPEGRVRFASLSGGPPSAILVANCLDFIQVLAAPHERLASVARSELEEVIRTDAIILPAWNMATGGPVNIRMFSWLKEKRSALEVVRGALPEPVWWKDIEARVEPRASTSRPATADGEP